MSDITPGIDADNQDPRSNHPRARGGSSHGRDTPVHVVRDVIRSEIRHGVHPIGSKLSEDSLVESLHASRATVREAIQILTNEGYLERRRRVGTTVLPKPVSIHWRGFFPEASTGIELVSTMLPDRILAAPDLIRRTLTLTGENVLLRQYALSFNDIPVGFRIAYRDAIHTGIGPQRGPNDLDALFEQVFDAKIGRIQTTLEYAPSDDKTSRELGVAEGFPMLVREQIFYDDQGNARELAFVQMRADMVSFSEDETIQRA